MRYTQGKFSMEGVFPVSRTFDSLGMMAKTPRDLADITDALTSYFKMGGPKAVYANSMSGSWKDLRVGVVAPEKWKWSPELAKPNKGVESQLVFLPPPASCPRYLNGVIDKLGYRSATHMLHTRKLSDWQSGFKW
jgi:Asp-tRNA(Asn)/Glu-tRNA(Gln) amidotransferase A subunit family amidase